MAGRYFTLKMTNYLITYDISSDPLRDKVSVLLKQHGCLRVQKSVFLAPKFSAKELRALKAALHRLLGGKLGPEESIIGLQVSSQQLEGGLWEGQSPGLDNALDDSLHLLI